MYFTNTKTPPRPTPPGGAVQTAETEATRIREIQAAGHRLGASRRLIAASIACGISPPAAAAMFEAARQISSPTEPVAALNTHRRWEADDALRAEFATLERYSAWAKAQAAGRANISKPVAVH